MAFPIPSGYTANQLGQANDLSHLDDLIPLEAAQAEGTRMLWGFTFSWRFPLFDSLASGLNWTLKQVGVTPWPEYQDICFVDASDPVWYFAWHKQQPWLLAIITALVPVIVVIVAVFLGSLLWRVLPSSITQPIEQVLAMLPSLLPLVVIMALAFFLPQLTKMLSPPKEASP